MRWLKKNGDWQINNLKIGKDTRIEIDWVRVGMVLGALAALVLVIWGISALTKGKITSAQPKGTAYELPELKAYTPKTARPVASSDEREETAIDLSSLAVKVVTEHETLDVPGIYGDELVYSAGTGRADEPVLKTLYYYDINTSKETELAQATVNNGEIYECKINDKWIVWVDTDQLGENQIFMLPRGENANADGDDAGKPRLIKNCKFQRPKLRLSGDMLIWIEQTREDHDRLFIVDLVSGEDMALSDLEQAASYGVSAPSVFENQIIWAVLDNEQTTEDRAKEEHSMISCVDLARLGEGDGSAALTTFSPHMYVHEPVNNADAWAWLDGNRSPTSALFIRYGGKIEEIARGGITTYGLGDDFLMYGRNEAVWAYFYKTGITVRLTPKTAFAKLPSVSGRRVAWFIDSGGSTDEMYTAVIDQSDLPK